MSSTDSQPLDALFASVPRFHERAGRTAWLVNEAADEELRGAKSPAECLHRNLESALAALQRE